MYKTGIIIDEKFLSKYDFYNFHPGNLWTNRGRHPLVHTILDNLNPAVMSLYKLSGGIDEGLLIAEYELSFGSSETPVSLEHKLEKSIPALLDKLVEFFRGGNSGIPVYGGTYRKAITETDYMINFANDSDGIIKRKIQSQRCYKGAILHCEGKVYRCVGLRISDTILNKANNEIEMKRNEKYYYFAVS
jgi:methionyl-tRNA formyltransferase